MKNAYQLRRLCTIFYGRLKPGTWASLTMMAALVSLWETPGLAQNDTPCECVQRWEEGATWNNGSINDAPNAPPPNGIIRCGSSAETQSQVAPINNCVYNSNFFEIDLSMQDCVEPSTGNSVSVLPPTNGQPIIWLNFDVRPGAGSFQVQINDNSGDNIGWALYSSDVVTNGTSLNAQTGFQISGDCSQLTLRACGEESANTWNTLPVPNFSQTTNYYLAIWDQDADGNLRVNNFKARFGCGDADILVCSLEGEVDTVCVDDGSTYTLEIPINGINGEFIAYEQIQGVFSGPVCLTNPADPNPVTSGTFQFSYNAGDSYDIIIFETTKDPNALPTTPVVASDPNCLHPTPFPNSPGSNGNADDCVLTFTGTLPSALSCSTLADAPVSCTGDGSDGQASVFPIGGSPPYSYLWDNGETTETATMLAPGPHSVDVTDALGCTVSCDVNILPAQNCCTCENPPMVTCPDEVYVGCNPPLDANGYPLSLGAGGQYEPDITLVTVVTDNMDCTATVTWQSDGTPTTTDGCTYTLLRTYRATNDCEGLFAECTQEFSWAVFDDAFMVECPADPLLPACSSTADILAAYVAWVDGFSFSGGCTPTDNIVDVPALGDLTCGGQLSFTYEATSGPAGCQDVQSCTATFTVAAADDLTVDCPADPLLPPAPALPTYWYRLQRLGGWLLLRRRLRR
ncbi:MAG: SprB repeat-containing protein [Lewinellaceae bacterium]|nr:SprB repeat-containing protein [Lewinellaceae bacterium]